MIYEVCKDRSFLDQLTRIARKSPTATAHSVFAVAALQDLPPLPVGTPGPCVIAAPSLEDDPFSWLQEIRRRFERPKVILLLPRDDSALAFGLLRKKIFDIAYRHSFSTVHLREAIARAADGAPRPSYGAVCTDTPEFNPSPGSPWALVFHEGVAAETDKRDLEGLRTLPVALRLGADALLFQEVLTPALPDLLEVPSLVFALLSAEPANDRGRFLAAMRALEADGRRVVYLLRVGVALPPDLPPNLKPAHGRTIRYASAIELGLRLFFGFGG